MSLASKTFALQRREARPTGALLFLWCLFLLPIGTCGGIGGAKLRQTQEPIVPIAEPATLASSRDVLLGSFVQATLELSLLAHDEFPVSDSYAVVANGYYAYAIRGVPDVVVLSSKAIGAEAAARGGVVVEGQICAAFANVSCSLPRDELSSYVRSLERERKTKMRVLLADRLPGDTAWEAWLGLGVSGLVMIAALFATLLLIRVAQRSGRLALEQTFTLAMSPEVIRAKLRGQASALCRIAYDAADGIVLLVGKPAGRVRLSGARKPEDIPLRIDLEFGAGDAYRGTSATLRVRELMNRPPSAVANVLPADPTPLAVRRAAGWLLDLCAQGSSS
jgi:hypothetical protein